MVWSSSSLFLDFVMGSWLEIFFNFLNLFDHLRFKIFERFKPCFGHLNCANRRTKTFNLIQSIWICAINEIETFHTFEPHHSLSDYSIFHFCFCSILLPLFSFRNLQTLNFPTKNIKFKTLQKFLMMCKTRFQIFNLFTIKKKHFDDEGEKNQNDLRTSSTL